jgi:hypothetical protein
MCDLERDSFVSISCPKGSKIQVTNAYLYDDEEHFENKNCSHSNTLIIKLIVSLMETKCNNYRNCTFSHLMLHDMSSNNVTCESASFDWMCVSFSSELDK